MISQNLNNILFGIYGVIVINNINGCVIIEMFMIFFLLIVFFINIENILCVGEIFVVGGIVYDESNLMGINILIVVNGCDFIVNVNLSFLLSIENIFFV